MCELAGLACLVAAADSMRLDVATAAIHSSVQLKQRGAAFDKKPTYKGGHIML